eukprot:CAMPEP_0117419276 /NCGR_PEP_ID=MMETSP0758-20121206/871_1 /TAXON_ID=63605 /ORGANISM="Percolomonas cosmopolitus, Strain AE-1 (ATCC 50343)" /LENGTH=1632 /DNA_ID=CAMNT_0005200245 /DNA_START=200 /DNA_END=5098 /DNA_ORIENTATION=+
MEDDQIINEKPKGKESKEEKLRNRIERLKVERELMDIKVEYYKKSQEYKVVGKTENINEIKIDDDAIAVVIDIPNSHDMWQKAEENNVIEEYKESINLYKSIVKKEINMYGGTMVDNGLTNEYLKCSFEKDVDAIEFALQLQFLLLEAEWPNVLVNTIKPECAEILKEEEAQQPQAQASIFESKYLFKGLRCRAVCAYGNEILDYDNLCDYANGGEVILSTNLWNNVSKLDWTTLYSFPVYIHDIEGDDETIVHLISPSALEKRYEIIEAERIDREEIEKSRAFPKYHIKNRNFLEYRDILDDYIQKLEETLAKLPEEEEVKEEDVVVVVDTFDKKEAPLDTPKLERVPLVESKPNENEDEDELSVPFDFEHVPPGEHDAISIPPISALSEKTEYSNEKLLADALAMNQHLQEKLGEKEQLIKDLSKKFANALTSVDRTLSAKKRIEQQLTSRLAFYNEHMFKADVSVESLSGKKLILVGVHLVDAEVLWENYQEVMKECYHIYRGAVHTECKKFNGTFISQDCEYVVCGFDLADDAIRFSHNLLETMRQANYSPKVLENRYCVQIEQKSAVQLRGPRIRIAIRQGDITREDCNITVDKSSLLAQQTEQSATSIIYISKDIYETIPNVIAEYKMKNVKEAAIVPKGKASGAEHTVALVPKSFMFFDDKSTKLYVMSILQAQLAKTKREITVLSDMVHNAETTQDLEKRVVDLQQQIETSAAKNNELMDEIETLRLENELAQEDNQLISMPIQIQDDAELRKEIESLKSQLANQSKVVIPIQVNAQNDQQEKDQEKEIEQLKKQIEQFQPISLSMNIGETAGNNEEIQQLQKTIEEKEKSESALNQQLNDVNKQLESQNDTIIEMKRERDEMQGQIQKLNNEISALTKGDAALELLQEESKKTSALLKEKQETIHSLEKQLQNDKSTHEEKNKKQQEAIKALENERDSLKNDLELAQNEVTLMAEGDEGYEILEEELENARKTIETQKTSLETKEKERVDLNAEVEKLRKEVDALSQGDEAVELLQKESKKAEEQLKQQKETISALETERDEKQKLIDQATEEQESLKKELQTLKDSESANKKKLDESTTALDKRQASIEALELQLKEANETIHQMGDGDKAFEAMESQLKEVNADLKQKMERVHELESEKKKLLDQHEELERKMKKEATTAQDEQEALVAEKTKLTREFETEKEKASQEVASLNKQVNDANEELTSLKSDKKQLQNALKEKDASVAALESKLSVLSTSSDANASEKKQLLDEVTELKSTLRRQESTIEDGEREIKKLKKTLSDNSAVAELEEKVAAGKSKEKDLQQQIDQLLEEKSTLIQEKGVLEGSQSASATKMRSIEETIDVYKKRADAANEEYEQLKAKMKQRATEIETLEDELAASKKSHKTLKRDHTSLMEEKTLMEDELAALKKKYNSISKVNGTSSPIGSTASDAELVKKNNELQYQLKLLGTKTDMKIADLEYKHSVIEAENHRLKTQLSKSKSHFEKKLREKERKFQEKLHKLELQNQINQVKSGYENQLNSMRDRHQMEMNNQGMFGQYIRSPSTVSNAPSTPPQHQQQPNSPSSPTFTNNYTNDFPRTPQQSSHLFSPSSQPNGNYQPVDSTHSPIQHPNSPTPTDRSDP